MRPGPPTVGCPAAGSPQAGFLAWFRPDRAADRETLEKWCTAAGPPVFVQSPGEPSAAAAIPTALASDTIAVVTWNVHVGAGDIPAFLEAEAGWRCSGPGRDRPDQDADRVRAPGGSQPVLMLIQEAYRASADLPAPAPGSTVRPRIEGVPRDGPRKDIVRVARECGLALLYVPSMRNGRDEPGRLPEDRGNAILSSLPLSSPAAIELPFESQRRVVVAAEATLAEGVSIRLVSIHLDVVASLLRALVLGGTSRVRQGEGLFEALAEIETLFGPLHATVAGGDLNTWSSRETVIQRFRETFPDSPPAGDERTRGDFPADHLFVRAEPGGRVGFVHGTYRVVEDAYGSDHKARVGRMYMRR